VLAQFGTNTNPITGGTPGPTHNSIVAPDRAVDNSTHWQSDFSQAHFNQMYNGPGESLADFYMKQSGGKYSTSTAVSDWVQLPLNEARYGHNFPSGLGFDDRST
jgi:immune inhibitor A